MLYQKGKSHRKFQVVGDEMDGPGTITWEEFVTCSDELLQLSNEITDHWEFLGDKKLPGQAYLKRREKTFVPIDYPIDEVEDEDWGKDLETSRDPYEAAPRANARPLIIEHHVLWSMSYGVPVLYFNGWRSESPGINPVSVEVAQRLLTDKLAYSELSQAIHPIVGRPFLQLHPCGSRELLQITSRSANKLVSWLSAVGPAALGLKLRPEYFKLTTMKKREETN